jgi:hypothetical protein
MADDWQVFAYYNDQASAEAIAGLLRSEKVTAVVSGDQPIPGLAAGFRVLVPNRLMHRARWVLAQIDAEP